MTQGWKLPDGTPCGKEGTRASANRYCVNGECRAFDCNGYSSEHMNSEPCMTTSAYKCNQKLSISELVLNVRCLQVHFSPARAPM